jgi:ubiquinone/menaquinone biosynthesis C-methylase UbiE
MEDKMPTLDRPMSGLGFKLMALAFSIRDFIRPRKDVLKEAGLEPGFGVLDFGCGPGGYIGPLAEEIGPAGKIYALDVNPLAIKKVREIAARKAIQNLSTIESDCKTGLPDEHVDVVLLYDTFHHLSRPEEVLLELHRVLKPGGTLSFSDHHMNEQEIVAGVTSSSLFKLRSKGKKTYRFSKQG